MTENIDFDTSKLSLKAAKTKRRDMRNIVIMLCLVFGFSSKQTEHEYRKILISYKCPLGNSGSSGKATGTSHLVSRPKQAFSGPKALTKAQKNLSLQ